MHDILPYPNITATDPKEQLSQINNYLIQLKEGLEFALTSISADNLSPELRNQLSSLSVEIRATKEEQEDATQQIANKTITVSDVINSQLFKEAVPSDYIVSGEQTTTSLEDGGENVFTFKRAEGGTETFICRNGSRGDKGDTGEKGDKGDKGDTPKLSLEINYSTGELLYTSS